MSDYPPGTLGYEHEALAARYQALADDCRDGTMRGEIAALIIERIQHNYERRFRRIQNEALARVWEATR